MWIQNASVLTVDVTFFQELVDITGEYESKGDFFITGDFNSRIGLSDDYVSDNNLHRFIDNVPEQEDIQLPQRQSRDKVVNVFGKSYLTCVKLQDWKLWMVVYLMMLVNLLFVMK